MKIRLAKYSDASRLAKLHIKSSKAQPGSFFYKLGYAFLLEYYKIFLSEENSIILCAMDDNKRLIGLVTGTSDMNEHICFLKKHKIRLGIMLIPKILINPYLIKEVLDRFVSLKNSKSSNYIIKEGARLEFWGWDPEEKIVMGSFILLKKWLEIMACLGINKVENEVDLINKKSLELHVLLGAKEKNRVITNDGRERIILEYDLNKYFN
jgi:hypothetical protein